MSSPDSTGWWTFQPDGPVMVHGVSGEQVVYAGQARRGVFLDQGAQDNWHRFEYRHTDLTYPIYVRIKDAKGPKLPWILDGTEPHRVWMADFERTAMTEDGFRGDNAKEPLPFGMWVRVREAVEDAFRCWPTTEKLGKHADRIILKGGWFGDWSPGIARLSAHRNSLFNRFGSRLLDDLPADFVGHNTVPLDTQPIRLWEIYNEQHGISNPTFELAHINSGSGFFSSFDSIRPSFPSTYFTRDLRQIDRIISCEFRKRAASAHLMPLRPPPHSSASLVHDIEFRLHPPHTNVFGHAPREVKVGRFGPRTLRPPNGLRCPTEVFASDPNDNQFVAANCFTSPVYSCLDQLYEPFDIAWEYHRTDKYPRFDKCRFARECLEALAGSNWGYQLHDQHFPQGVMSTQRDTRKAMLLGGGYVGGDLSLEPYCFTFIYTDQKRAGMAWIANRNPHVTEMAAKLANIHEIN